MVDLKFALDGLDVTVPVFVQPESEPDCLLGMNVLPQLGVKIHCRTGEPLKQSGVREAKARVRLVQTVVIPNHKAKFFKAKIDNPVPIGRDFVFEPDVEGMSAHGVVAPEALVTLRSDCELMVPLENYDGSDVRLEHNTVLGHVVVHDTALCDFCEVPREGASGQLLRVQADSGGPVVRDRWRKLMCLR